MKFAKRVWYPATMSENSHYCVIRPHSTTETYEGKTGGTFIGGGIWEERERGKSSLSNSLFQYYIHTCESCIVCVCKSACVCLSLLSYIIYFTENAGKPT